MYLGFSFEYNVGTPKRDSGTAFVYMLVFYLGFFYVVHMSDDFEISFQSSSNVCYFVVIL